jgi:glycosyltransferase involved in cell wall biosynthesis
VNIALVTPPRSARSTAGECAWRLLPHLCQHAEVEVYVPREHADAAPSGIVLRSAAELSPKRHDHILYCVADEAACAFIPPLVRELGGTVVLHDWVLSELAYAAHPELARPGVRGFAVAAREGGLLEARAWFARSSAPAAAERAHIALNRSIVRTADSFVVHGERMRERILADRNAPTPIGVLTHGAERMWSDEPCASVRARIGLPPSWSSAFVVASSGPLLAHKCIDRLVEAVAAVRTSRDDVRLLLVAEPRAPDFDVEALVRRLAASDIVRVAGRLTDEQAVDHLRACNLAVELREPSRGGMPSAIFRALAAGRAVVTSDVPEHRELPSACAMKIAPGDGEARTLAQCIVSIRDDPATLASMQRAARAYVAERCHWSIVARELARMLERFPPPRSKRRSLVRAMIEASERRSELPEPDAPTHVPTD